MERMSVLFVMLVLCSLSGAELPDNEIGEEEKITCESVNQPQACPSDLHAVLREISVKLAENRLMIQQMQTLNQEQNAKLSKNEDILQQLKTLDQEQEAKLSQYEDTLQQLQTRNKVEQVAFSVSLLASGSSTTGPYNAHTTLIFKHVVSNIGKAYNTNTGFFTAPVRGAYHFEFYIGAYGHSTQGTAVMLVKNEQHIFAAWEHNKEGFGSSANGATLLLEAGDVVFLLLWQNTRIYDNENHHSTFSGHLLFPM